MKLVNKSVIYQSLIILTISIIIGFIVNIFNPNGVQVTTNRPQLQLAPDTILAEDLPGVEINTNNTGLKEEANIPSEPFMVRTEQVLDLITEDKAVFIDARRKKAYLHEHLPEAINISIEDIYSYEDSIKNLPKDKWLICYCDNPSCDLGQILAFELVNKGFKKALYYKGGIAAWKKAGKATIQKDNSIAE